MQQQARRISFPARLAAGYVLLAGLWVLTSDWLLRILVSDAGRILQLQSWKGVAFVVVTGLMLYAVLHLRRVPAPVAAGDGSDAEPLHGWIPFLVFAVLALVLGGVGYAMYRSQARDYRNHVYGVHSAIAELKGRQIEQWLGERRADSEVLRSSGTYAESILKLQRPGGGAVAAGVQRRLETLRAEYDFASVELFDREGKPLLQVGRQGMPGPVLRKAVAAAIATDLTQFSDLYLRAGSTSEARIDFVIPLAVGGDVAAPTVGALALRIDPQRFLFPLIQSGPIPSRSGETVLVWREQQEVVFLNPLRHVDNKPFALRRPLSQETLPAVQAILKGKGIYEGVDYRGVEVMTAFRPVGGTSWIVGVKTDVDEVMSPLHQKASLMFVMFGLAIGTGALFVGLFWREQRSRYLIGHYRHQMERQALVKHFDHLVKYARDIVLLMDAQGNILDANDAAANAYGYTRDELGRMSIRDIRTPKALSELERDLERAARPGGALTETVHRRKDGSTFPVEASERVIEVEGKSFWQSIVRDITARRAAEEEIRRLNTAYVLLSETNEAIVRVSDERELFDGVCRVAVMHGGYRGAWIGLADEDGRRRIRRVARAGTCGEDPPDAVIGTDADPEGRGPSAVALREGRASVCNDILADPAQASWSEAARKAGIKAVAAMPLIRAGKPVGVLNLCSGDTDAFDDRVLHLLGEMAADISFALDNFAHEEERRVAVRTLHESEELFRSVVEQNIAAIFIIEEGKFAYANSRAAEILGYRHDEMEGMAIAPLVVEQDRPLVMEKVRRVLSGELPSASCTFRAMRKDGTAVEIGAHGAGAVFRGKRVLIGVAQDIGERLRTEEQIRQYVVRLEQSTLTTVQAVSAMVELRDPYTAGHERRVGELAAAIGAEMQLAEEMVKGLRITGYVHDIGKIGIPAEILSKPGRLTATEFELIKNHARVGYEILKDVQFPWPVAEIILQHHERLDGSGYPQQLRDGAIMLQARVLAVADVVESMGSHRPYRPALGVEAALDEINRNAGRLYDADVVSACTRLFREKGYNLAV